MRFLDAAHRILTESGKPLRYREIAERALERGLLDTTGTKPEATMNAQLGTDIKRAEAAFSPCRFARVGRGVYGLSEWEGSTPTTPNSEEEHQASYLTYKEAALQVLRASGQPLSAQDITERATAQGLINPPAGTLMLSAQSHLTR